MPTTTPSRRKPHGQTASTNEAMGAYRRTRSGTLELDAQGVRTGVHLDLPGGGAEAGPDDLDLMASRAQGEPHEVASGAAEGPVDPDGRVIGDDGETQRRSLRPSVVTRVVAIVVVPVARAAAAPVGLVSHVAHVVG